MKRFAFAFICLLWAVAAMTPVVSVAQDELVDLIVGLLGDDDKDIRALAYEQVRTEAPGEAATKKFAALLFDFPPETQVGLLSALASRGDQAAAPAVQQLLAETEDADVKVAAIRALGPLGEADHVASLVEFLTKGSPDEQTAASRALVQVSGSDASMAMAEQMKSTPSDTKVSLMQILTTRRALNTIDHLLAAAVGNDVKVRTAAMAALGELADAEHMPGLVRGVLAAERGRERDTAEKRVMLVCHRAAGPSADPALPLLAAIKPLNLAKQNAMLSTLGRVGGASAREVIEEAVADEDAKQHELGLNALCNWPDASISFRLLQLARVERNAGLRRRALRSLIRVAPLPDDRTDQRRLDTLRTAMAMCEEEDDRLLILERAKAVRAIETLRFVLPYVDQDDYAEQACLTVVELAHHSGLRESHREEFQTALDYVSEVTQDATVKDRAQRYKKGETWVRPGSGN